ncbi:hypothetical protein LPJ66_012154, partial [Kickxella alabastrina]
EAATQRGKRDDKKTIPLLRSCERCRRRKQKCGGEQPICARCKSHSTECSYRKSGRFRKRFPNTEDQGQESGPDLNLKRHKLHFDASDTLLAATTLSALSTQLPAAAAAAAVQKAAAAAAAVQKAAAAAA